MFDFFHLYVNIVVCKHEHLLQSLLSCIHMNITIMYLGACTTSGFLWILLDFALSFFFFLLSFDVHLFILVLYMCSSFIWGKITRYI